MRSGSGNGSYLYSPVSCGCGGGDTWRQSARQGKTWSTSIQSSRKGGWTSCDRLRHRPGRSAFRGYLRCDAMSGDRLPLPGRIIGYALTVVVVAVAARVVWELLNPLLPVLCTLLALVGVYWVVLGRGRG